MINRREFVKSSLKFGTVGALSLVVNKSISFADQPTPVNLEKTINTAIDNVSLENFSQQLKEIENQLTQAVTSGKVTLEDIKSFEVTQYELFTSRIWKFSIGGRFLFFARPIEETYVFDREVVSYDEIAKALELPLKYNLEMQYKAIA